LIFLDECDNGKQWGRVVCAAIHADFLWPAVALSGFERVAQNSTKPQ
jgi:hypothetical protein